jgi:hypothetical protein
MSEMAYRTAAPQPLRKKDVTVDTQEPVALHPSTPRLGTDWGSAHRLLIPWQNVISEMVCMSWPFSVDERKAHARSVRV